MAEYDFVYPSVTESEQQMLDDLFRALRENGVEANIIERVALAVSEAYTNAYVHGNLKNPNKVVRIHLAVDEKCVVADIIDEGQGGLKQDAGKKLPGPWAVSGRGLALIRHCADSVTFGQYHTGGLAVSLTVERKEKQKV